MKKHTMAHSEVGTATSSEEEQKEQKPIDVMFLCDEWKSSKGGLSTFNREFATNLAQATTGSMKIHCYVSNSDDRDREEAKQHGVNLITAKCSWFSRSPRVLEVFTLRAPKPTSGDRPWKKAGYSSVFSCSEYKV